MRRIAGLSTKKPLKKPAAKVRKAPPRTPGARGKAARKSSQLYCCDLLGRLFKGYQPDEIKVWGERYPAYMRANLQPVIEELFMANADQCVGAIPRYSSQDLELTELMNTARDDASPLARSSMSRSTPARISRCAACATR